jgi:hypothetical protein
LLARRLGKRRKRRKRNRVNTMIRSGFLIMDFREKHDPS